MAKWEEPGLNSSHRYIKTTTKYKATISENYLKTSRTDSQCL